MNILNRQHKQGDSTKPLVKKTSHNYFALAIFSILIAAALFALRPFQGLDFKIQDVFLPNIAADPRLVIVDIDSESISHIGQWPWSREVYAKLFENMSTAPPLVVGMDIILSESGRLDKEGDSLLSEELKKLNFPVVLASQAKVFIKNSDNTYRAEGVLLPNNEFLQNKNVTTGIANIISDRDNLIRHFVTQYTDADNQGQDIFASKIVQSAKLNGLTQKSPGRILYSGKPRTIRHVPALSIIDPKNADMLRGKIVLIGVTSPDLHDEQLTPTSRGQAMPGVEIQANIVNQVIAGKTAKADNYLVIIIFLLSAVYPLLIFKTTKKPVLPLLISLGVGSVIIFICLYIISYGILLPIVSITLLNTVLPILFFVYRYLAEYKEKRMIEKTFSKYVSKEVLASIVSNPSQVTLGGQEKKLTILFSDIRGFTSISESLTPAELVKLLNRYFTSMTSEIIKHGGVVDKYIGDAIMAFWGAPLDDSSQEDNAYLAAKGMLERLKEFNQQIVSEGLPAIDIGVGIYTGLAVVGNVGSEERFDYTVIGDTVNVASRLEGVNKEYGTQLIIGETTQSELKYKDELKYLGGVKVKGREEEVQVYTLK